MTPPRRILCVWLPYWATTRLHHARAKDGAPPDECLATVAAERGVRRLISVCPRAEAAGLSPGQTLTQARALCPALHAAEAEPEQDAEALAALAQWCTRYTPLAAAGRSTLLFDLAGCDHLFGGEAALAADLAARLERWGLLARWAIAATPGAAHALAHHDHARIVPTGAEAPALAPLPIEALRLSPANAAGLRRLGFANIGALERLPRADLAARFGADTTLRLDQAHGRAGEAIAWPPPPPDWTETERFAEPIITTEACQAVLHLLTQRLCARLAAKTMGGRQFVAAFQRVDGSTQPVAIATALPVRDPAYLLRLLAEKLNGLDPGFGIEAASLSALVVTHSPTQQQDFSGATAGATQRLAQLVDTLTNRLRPGRLWRLAPRDSHIPERAAQPVPPLPARAIAGWDSDPAAPRPIRLLHPPERIDVTAPLPDDPPAQFRWRGALHRVRAATGPERIGAEWWTRTDGDTRDYYQVEDIDGARYWMFRAARQWFLHGLFG